MSFEDETNQLRWSIAACIGSWPSCFPSILLGSSGGLDSSFVAVAATPRSERTTAPTLVSTGITGDSPPYSPSRSRSLGIPFLHSTLELPVHDVDLRSPLHH